MQFPFPRSGSGGERMTGSRPAWALWDVVSTRERETHKQSSQQTKLNTNFRFTFQGLPIPQRVEKGQHLQCEGHLQASPATLLCLHHPILHPGKCHCTSWKVWLNTVQPWRQPSTKATVPHVAADTWHPAEEEFILINSNVCTAVTAQWEGRKRASSDATEEQEELYVCIHLGMWAGQQCRPEYIFWAFLS